MYYNNKDSKTAPEFRGLFSYMAMPQKAARKGAQAWKKFRCPVRVLKSSSRS
jgi:hypothetical protein